MNIITRGANLVGNFSLRDRDYLSLTLISSIPAAIICYPWALELQQKAIQLSKDVDFYKKFSNLTQVSIKDFLFKRENFYNEESCLPLIYLATVITISISLKILQKNLCPPQLPLMAAHLPMPFPPLPLDTPEVHPEIQRHRPDEGG